MARWTNQSEYTPVSSGEVSDGDLAPWYDGSNQRTISMEVLRAALAGEAEVNTRDPTSTDDTTQGYSIGSVWYNSSSGSEAAFIATDVTEDNAVWDAWPGSGGGASELDDLSDVDLTTEAEAAGDLLRYDGSDWVPVPHRQSFVIACSDESSDLETGTAKVTFRMPYPFIVEEVRASATDAPTGSGIQVDINEGGASILSTEITIDDGEKTSETAATAPVISDSALADDAEVTIDIDAVGSTTPGAGLKVTITGRPA